jgi:hypothetical protein
MLELLECAWSCKNSKLASCCQQYSNNRSSMVSGSVLGWFVISANFGRDLVGNFRISGIYISAYCLLGSNQLFNYLLSCRQIEHSDQCLWKHDFVWLNPVMIPNARKASILHHRAEIPWPHLRFKIGGPKLLPIGKNLSKGVSYRNFDFYRKSFRKCTYRKVLYIQDYWKCPIGNPSYSPIVGIKKISYSIFLIFLLKDRPLIGPKGVQFGHSMNWRSRQLRPWVLQRANFSF